MAHALASALDASNSNIHETQKSLAEMSLGAVEPSFKSEDEREIQLKSKPKEDHDFFIERENQQQQQQQDDEFKFPHVEYESDKDGEDDLLGMQSAVPLADSSNSQLLERSTASLKSKSKSGSSRRESGGGKPMTLKEQEEVCFCGCYNRLI